VSGSREASGLRVSLAPLSGAADHPANPVALIFNGMANDCGEVMVMPSVLLL